MTILNKMKKLKKQQISNKEILNYIRNLIDFQKIKANTFSKLYYKIKKSNFNFKLFV